jgi:hypothetical protein
MNVDQELRAALRERAETYRPGEDLMAAVRVRQRRHRQRRMVVAAAAAVVVAVAAPAVVAALRLAPQAPVAVLVTPAAAPSFPVTPGWEPDWVGLRSFTYERGPAGVTAVLRYEPTFPFRAELSVAVTDQDPALGGETVQIADHAATLATADDRISLVWPLGPEWVRVDANDRVSYNDLSLYAASLTNHPMAMALPFTIAALPATAELALVDRYRMVYRRAGSDAQITVSVQARDSSAMAALDSTADSPDVVANDGSITAYQAVGSDRILQVQATAGWDLTKDQVLSIARGVNVTAVALTSGG